jgi:hypothetical protein
MATSEALLAPGITPPSDDATLGSHPQKPGTTAPQPSSAASNLALSYAAMPIACE